MKYPTEAEIAEIKQQAGEEMGEYKKNRAIGHLSIGVLLLVVCGLVACTAAMMNSRPTPPPPAVALAPVATSVSPTALLPVTATSTPFVTSTFPPTRTPVYGTPLPSPVPAVPATVAIPATLPPLPTHTAAPTYTPPPTWTPAATWTPQATQTPQATAIPLVVTRNVIQYEYVPAESSPYPLLAAIALAVFAIGIGLLAALRRPVQPAPIIVQPAPARLPSPTVTPVFLRPNAPVTPVQSPPEVAPVTPPETPVTPPAETMQNGNGSGVGAATIKVSVEPADAAEDIPLLIELCRLYNQLERPSLNALVEAKWGENGKNTVRLALARRAIQWGREQNIIGQPAVTKAKPGVQA